MRESIFQFHKSQSQEVNKPVDQITLIKNQFLRHFSKILKAHFKELFNAKNPLSIY